MTPERFIVRLECCRRYLEHYFHLHSGNEEAFNALELGTGWYPVVPVGLYLCGASEVWTFDIVPLLRNSRVRHTLHLFADFADRGTLQNHLPRLRLERMKSLREALTAAKHESPEKLLQKLKVHALVRDARDTGLSARTIDLFVSTSVLEYIPRGVLTNILREFQRLSRPGAVMSHFINLRDEFSRFDDSITPFNFLKYSDYKWKWLDSPLTRKSRLRISDYREVLAETGWEITAEENTTGSLAQLQQIHLAPEFLRYAQADLLVLNSWIVARLKDLR